MNPNARTYWMGLFVSVFIAALYFFIVRPPWTYKRIKKLVLHPSSQLDLQLFVGRQLLNILIGAPIVLSGWLLATKGVRWMDRHFVSPSAPDWSESTIVLLYSFVLFVCWDLSRFALHKLMHEVPFLWNFHQVHHSAEVLTPLTHHRIHPVESWLYTLRGMVVTAFVAGSFYWVFRTQLSPYTILGVPSIGFLLNVSVGNLRHSQVWIRYPTSIEKWFISPAQHQIHHSNERKHYGKNYGTWLAIWDRMFRSWLPADEKPVSFGIENANHKHNLLSAWFGPFRKYAPIVLVLLASTTVYAEDDDNNDDAEDKQESEKDSSDAASDDQNQKEDTVDGDRFGEAMIIYSDDETLRVAGSAQQVGQESLELYEFDNVEQVLQFVPGVATRNEDGFGLRPNIGIRGANSDRSAKITLMEDGVLFAPAPYAAPAAYYFPMATRIVGLEVFKGPAATRHGPFTVGGAINVLTREIPREATYAADIATGLRQTHKAHLWAGKRWNRVGLLVEGVHLQSDGFKELDGGGDTGFNRTELMLKSSVRQDNSDIELKLGYAREHSNETYLGLSSSDVQAEPYRRYRSSQLGDMRWNRTQVELAWKFKPTDHLRFHTVAYHHWLDRSWTKLNGFRDGTSLHQLLSADELSGQADVYMAILQGEEDSFDSGQYLQIGTNHRTFHSFGVQSKAKWDYYGDSFSSSLEFGIRFHGDDVLRVHTEEAYAMRASILENTDIGVETMLDSHAKANALAMHLHEELSFDWVHLFPSVRLEIVQGQREDLYVTTQESIVRATPLPGFAALFDIGDAADFFMGVHRGFSPVAPGQPEEVKPELSWNYESGIRFELGSSHAEVVGFFNDYSNLIGQCSFSGGCAGNEIDQQYNGGAVWIYGFESLFSTDIPLVSGMSVPIQGTYTLNRSSFQTDFYSSFAQFGAVQEGDSLPYLPTHQAALTLGFKTEFFQVSSTLSYRSALLDSAGRFDEGTVEVPGLLQLNAAVETQIQDKLSLYFTGRNLTNEQSVTSWRPFGARPVAPLQVMFGAKWTD
ncbi:MAG: TonB-dependent receptor [Myxococcota bacterium]|nr:TonB-dependent receptor [Myxococcota bacterium]